MTPNWWSTALTTVQWGALKICCIARLKRLQAAAQSPTGGQSLYPSGSVLGPRLFNFFTSQLPRCRQSAPSASWQLIPKWPGGWYMWWFCCHSVGPQQDGKLGWQEPNISTYRNVKSCTWGGITYAPGQAVGQMAEKQLCRKRHGDPGGHVHHEAATYLCSKEGQEHLH